VFLCDIHKVIQLYLWYYNTPVRLAVCCISCVCFSRCISREYCPAKLLVEHKSCHTLQLSAASSWPFRQSLLVRLLRPHVSFHVQTCKVYFHKWCYVAQVQISQIFHYLKVMVAVCQLQQCSFWGLKTDTVKFMEFLLCILADISLCEGHSSMKYLSNATMLLQKIKNKYCLSS
jgi:hypothetical protein